jgi:hypothetical protein
MCAPVNRRSFVASIATLVPAAALLRPTVQLAETRYLKPRAAAPGKRSVSYICPPGGQPCDKLTFDKPGSYPVCGMTLIPAGGAGVPTVAMPARDVQSMTGGPAAHPRVVTFRASSAIPS